MAKTDLSTLTPNPRNPRTITKKKLAMLRESMAYYGDLSGIIQVEGGDLVGGHQRVEAYRADPKATVTITQTFDPPLPNGTVAEGYVEMAESRFAYRVCRWAPDKAQAAALAANKGAGAWELNIVADMMAELDTSGFDLDLTLFDADERRSLMSDQVDPDEGDGGEGEGLEPPAEPKTKLGDLYQLGRHRLLCGDATNVQHLDLVLGGAMPDILLTDPPYGMNLDTDFDGMFAADKTHRKTGKRHKAVEGDDQPYDPTDMLAYFHKVPEMVLWGADYYRQHIPTGGSWYVWDKRCDDNMDKVVGNVFELAWSRQNHKREVCRLLWSGHHGMQADDTKTRVHPTQKPVKLLRWLLDRLPGKLVCDPYSGSGSTLIACEQDGRTCCALELDPAYVDQIVARWEKLTGETAVRVEQHDLAVAEEG